MYNSETFSFTDFFRILASRFRFITVFITAGFILSLIIPFILPKEYRSSCSILPSGGNRAGKLNAALSMMNLNMPTEVNSESSSLFPAILKSRRLRESLLKRKVSAGGRELPLAEITGGETLEDALERLEEIISVRQDEKTGFITVSSTTGDPELSRDITSNLISLLREFNREKRRSKAWHNYRFIAGGVEKARKEMEQAEEELAEFEKTHRHFMESTNPQVLMQHRRLERQLEIMTGLFIDMARELEIAGIELKKKTPIVRVLDRAEIPAMKSGPPRKAIAVLGAALTLFLGLLIPVSREVPPSVILRKLFLEESRDEIPEGEERTAQSGPSETSSEKSGGKRYVRQ